MAYFVAAVLIINISLWVILLIRFKKLFNTEKIIDKTNEKLSKIINEIDTATERDMYLSREATNRIQNKIEEAERTIELFKEATNRLRDLIAESDKINKMTQKKNYSSISPDAAFEVKMSNQQDLFESAEKQQNAGRKPVVQSQINVTSDGAAYEQIPIINSRQYEDLSKKVKVQFEEEKPSTPGSLPKSDIAVKVQNLYDQGYKIEEIATKLSRSVTEVQFIIDMGF